MRGRALALVLITLLLGSLHQVGYRIMSQNFRLLPLLILYGQSLGGWIILSLWFKAQGTLPDFSLMGSPSQRLFSLRALLALAGHLCFIRAIHSMPLFIVTLSSYLGLFMTSLGAMIFLEKKVPLGGVLALIFALMGINAIHPLQEFFQIHPYAVVATLCFSLSSLLTKQLTQTHSSLEIVYQLVLKMTLGSALLLAFQDPWALVFYGDPSYFVLFMSLALVYLSLHTIMTQSYQETNLSWISLAKTLKIPLSATIDFTVYGQAIGYPEYIGSLFIFLAMGIHESSLDIERFASKIRQLRVRTKALS